MFLLARGQSAALLHRPRCALFSGQAGRTTGARANSFGGGRGTIFNAKSPICFVVKKKNRKHGLCQTATKAQTPTVHQQHCDTSKRSNFVIENNFARIVDRLSL